MRNTILLLIVITGVCASCGKKDVGYFSLVHGDPVPSSTPISQYYYFNNVIIDSNGTDTFTLPNLTQGIIDSGVVTVTFRSSIVWLNNWTPLPSYTFPDGSITTVTSVNEQPGKVVLQAQGGPTPAMNYCFFISTN